MPATGTGTSTRRAAAARRHNGHTTGPRCDPPERAGDEGPPRGAPEPEATGHGAGRGHGRDGSKAPEPALGGLFRGLRAGDLEAVLLTVAMAADENRLPCADPGEEARILAFLARLAEHDATLPPPPPPPDGSGTGPEGPRSGTGAGDRAPARG